LSLKINFKLVIGGKEETQNLLELRVFNSIRFHTQHCELVVSNIKVNIDDPVELYLGYEKLYPIFKGYITDISNKKTVFIKVKDEYIKLIYEKTTKSFNRTTPKEIINSLVKYPKNLTEKSFIQKHHFPIWNESIDIALRRIQKTWKLDNFVWFFDIDGNFHFHEIKKLKDYPLDLTADLIKISNPRKDYLQVILTRPIFDIYLLDGIKVYEKEYLVETIIHTFQGNIFTTSLHLLDLSNLS